MTEPLLDKSLCLALALCFLLAGCGQGQQVPIKMNIVSVYEDRAPLGCIGSYWVTLLRSDDGRVDRLCGQWGKVGETIAGCWVEGHYDWSMNGFRRVCK